MRLPEEALELLQVVKKQQIDVGDVWLVPNTVLHLYDDEKGWRPWLVYRLQRPADDPPRAFLAPGTTTGPSGPHVSVEAGEGGVRDATDFLFKASAPLTTEQLAKDGKWIGRLDQTRLPEIEARRAEMRRIWQRRRHARKRGPRDRGRRGRE